MNEIVFTTAEWVKEKKIYPAARLFLNAIFCFSITIYLVNEYYQAEVVLSSLKNGEYLTWFIEGHFFIPVLILVCVWISTWMITELLFWSLKRYLTAGWKDGVANYEGDRKHATALVYVIRFLARKFGSTHVTKAQMELFYIEVRNSLTPDDLKELQEIFQEQNEHISKNIRVILRMMIAMAIYYSWLSYFSAWLFYLLLVVSIVVFLLMTLGSTLITIIPIAAKKLDEVAIKYFANSLPKKSELS